MISDVYIDSCNRLLGCMLKDKTAAAEIILRMNENDFIIDEHKLIFNTAVKLFGADTEITPQTIGGKTSDEIYAICKSMANLTPSSVEWTGVWQMIKNSAAVYHAAEMLEDIKDDTADMSADIDALRGKAERLVDVLKAENRKNAFDFNELQMEYIQNLGVPRKFIDFGMKKLTKTARCPKNGLVILAARPSVGKTAIGLQFCRHLCKDYRVGFFSLETDSRTVMDRLNAAASGVALDRLQDGDLSEAEVKRIIQVAKNKQNLRIYEAAGYTPEQLRSDIVRDRLEIVFVDYLQLMQSSNSKLSEYERVTYVSASLKNIATELNVTVVALSQLNRSISQYEEPDPSDLRSSGQIEQDANVILFLYIPSTTELEDPDDIENQEALRWLKIAKSKEGRLGKFKISFDGAYQRFTEGWEYYTEIEEENVFEQQKIGGVT